jgi:regulator of nucleoside diphosphate kinase
MITTVPDRETDVARPGVGVGLEKSNSRKVFITETDLKRLRALLISAKGWNVRDKQHLEGLRAELHRAIVVHPTDIPADTVTLNTKVLMTDLDTGESMTWILVMPGNANFDQRKISVLAPIGIALIGCRVGDVVEIEVPSGKTRFKIDAVLYQPEAAGQDLL